MYNCVVFDLDGTLVNSNKTIYLTVLDTLAELKLETIADENKFNSLIGHHFREIFDACNVEVPDIEYFIDVYKTKYFDYIAESVLYPGVIEILEILRENKIKTALLTTKAQDQAEKISKHFGIADYLNEIVGRNKSRPIKPDPRLLFEICSNLDVPIENTLMVGDTEIDIQCGKNANIKTCAVSFGYRDRDVIEKENPDFIIDNLWDLKDIVYNNK